MTGRRASPAHAAQGLALALTLGLAACSGGDDPPAADAVASTAVSSSLDTPGEDGGLAPADARAVHDHRLTMARLRQWEQAYENLAVISDRYRDFQRRHDELFDDDDDEPNVREMVAAFNGDAAVRRAIEGSGMSVRDFILTGMALSAGYMVDQMRRSGMPDMTVPMTSDQHLSFVRSNTADVERAMARLGELHEVLHIDDDDG